MKKHQYDNIGRKVFFLYPDTAEENIIREIINSEFEVYIVQDYTKVSAIEKLYQGSIFILNTDFPLPEYSWSEFIKKDILGCRLREPVLCVIGTPNSCSSVVKTVQNLPNHYAIITRQKNQNSLSKHVLAFLEEHNARGQRRYVRYGVNDKNATFSFFYNSREYAGTINDISAAGMSCVFNDKTEFSLQTNLPTISLLLGEKKLTLSGQVTLRRRINEDENLYVIMFNRRQNERKTEKIHEFIFHSLQEQMEVRLS